MAEVGSREWHLQQVKQFYETRGNLEKVADKLVAVMNAIKRRTDPTAIVQARPKSLASFSEKAIRKKNKYTNPVDQLTDLVGGRIITYTQAAADRVCQFIEDLDRHAVDIDWDNSENTADRLRPEEFGYRAMHYIVQLRPPNILGVDIESWIRPYKMEIQVCTMMQHVWAAIGHDRVYKTQLKIDDSMKRRLSAISALIETAQSEFERGIADIDGYREGFPPEVDPAALKEAEMIWESVITVEPYDNYARLRCGDHHASLEQWQKASEHYSQCADDTPGVLAKRGRAAEQLGDVVKAELLYEEAAKKDRRDWAVRCDLAELKLRQGRSSEAIVHYREAFEISPQEPRVFTGYVTGLVCDCKSSACTRALHGALDAVIEECNNRVSLGIDIPNTFLQAARCHLLNGDLLNSLDVYCKASLKCNSLRCLEAELRDVMAMQEYAGDDIHKFDCVAALLSLLTVVVSRRLHDSRQHSAAPHCELLDPGEEAKRLNELATAEATHEQARPTFEKPPIVIVAGGCDQNVEQRMKAYQATLEASFETFEGTLICGGTKAGISGLIGEVAKTRGSAVEAIGYLPSKLPAGDERDDENYRIYEVPGVEDYSPLGPIQTWADLLLADVNPSNVRLLGINGGDLSAFEFRLAMAMGATVGLVEDSGRAVSALLTDRDWKRFGHAAKLFNEAETIAPFVCAFCPTFQAIDPDKREEIIEKLAQAQHEAYRKMRLKDKAFVHPSILPWAGLAENYAQSNRQQVAYADRILGTEGFAIVLIGDPRPAVDLAEEQYDDLVRNMAPREHGRFNAERLADGWQYGAERDLDKKTSPYLMTWDKLSDEVRGWDGDPFKKLAAFLEPLGLKIVKIDSE